MNYRESIENAINELFNYADANAIKSFTHQIARGNNLNQEFKLTKRGFEFYVGYNGKVIQCQFENGKVWSYDIPSNSSIPEAIDFFKNKIQEYMIKNSLWEHKLG